MFQVECVNVTVTLRFMRSTYLLFVLLITRIQGKLSTIAASMQLHSSVSECQRSPHIFVYVVSRDIFYVVFLQLKSHLAKKIPGDPKQIFTTIEI